MVKRPKSPEINEDVRYFTVYQPFPLHANWIVPEEAARCANWIAECVGTAHIFAIHYKPKARGMILLEISKRFTDHGRLLGEHRWNEMLKNPTHEESQNVSRIFHSFYTTLRDAQKDGWKVIHIKPDWFKGWMPGEGEFRDPYPETRWCEVPPEDKTNKPLCRPIPREQKPPPPRNQAPVVVGSKQWVEQHVVNDPNNSSTNAWSSGARASTSASAGGSSKKPQPPPLSVATSSTNQNQNQNQNQGQGQNQYPALSSAVSPSPMSAGSRLASASGNNSGTPASAVSTTAAASTAKGGPSSKPVWKKPVSLAQFSAGDTTKTGKSWAAVPPAAPPGVKSPLAEEPPKERVNAWTKPLKRPPAPAAPKGAPMPLPNSNPNSNLNSPWSQPSALTPANASPWATSASLASPASETAPQIINANANAAKKNDEPWGSKAANKKKRDGAPSQSQPNATHPDSSGTGSESRSPPGLSKDRLPRSPPGLSRDRPPHQQSKESKAPKGSKKWGDDNDDGNDFAPSRGGGGGASAIREGGSDKNKGSRDEDKDNGYPDKDGGDAYNDPANEFLHPWEMSAGDVWGAPPGPTSSAADAWGAPPESTSGAGSNSGSGSKSAWGMQDKDKDKRGGASGRDRDRDRDNDRAKDRGRDGDSWNTNTNSKYDGNGKYQGSQRPPRDQSQGRGRGRGRGQDDYNNKGDRPSKWGDRDRDDSKGRGSGRGKGPDGGRGGGRGGGSSWGGDGGSYSSGRDSRGDSYNRPESRGDRRNDRDRDRDNNSDRGRGRGRGGGRGRGKDKKSYSASGSTSWNNNTSTDWKENPNNGGPAELNAQWNAQPNPATSWADAELKMDWITEPNPATSWADAELKMDWHVEPSASNSWGVSPPPDNSENQEEEVKVEEEEKEEWKNGMQDWGVEGIKNEEEDQDVEGIKIKDDVDMVKEEEDGEKDKGKGKGKDKGKAKVSDATSSMSRDGGMPASEFKTDPSSNDLKFDPNAGSSFMGNNWDMIMEPSASEAQLDWSGAPIINDWGVPTGGETITWDNLWINEMPEEKPPELVCPTHGITCKKGICRDMDKLTREYERKKKLDDRRHGGGRGRGGYRGREGYSGRGGEVDENGYEKPHKKTRRGKKWYEKNFTGKGMRAWADPKAGQQKKDGETAEGEDEGEETGVGETDASQAGEGGDDKDDGEDE